MLNICLIITVISNGFAMQVKVLEEHGYDFPSDKLVIDKSEEDRSSEGLVAVVEALGRAADGDCSRLEIVRISEAYSWEIHDHDGYEKVEFTHYDHNYLGEYD